MWLGETTPTTGRFSLARRGFPDGAVRDIISDQPVHGYRRFMAVNSELVDGSLYRQLADSNIPRLPRLPQTEGAPSGVQLFVVKEGLKPLVHESIHDRESSGTYIGDPEIFGQLGRLYGAVWRATGVVLLDAHTPEDSPLDHVAISSFSDGSDYLFLCPPYPAGLPVAVSLEQAQETFTAAVRDKLEVNIGIRLYDPRLNDLNQRLIEAARSGFGAGV